MGKDDYRRPEELAPPHDLEAERSVLGAVVISADALGEVLDLLRVSDFYRVEHRVLWAALVELYDRNERIDSLTLRSHLDRRGQLEAAGGVEYLLTVLDSVHSAAAAPHHARIVRDLATLRELVEAAHEIAQRGLEGREDPAILIDRAEAAVFAIAERRATRSVAAVDEVLREVFAEIDRRRAGGVSGLQTGFWEIDDRCAGLKPGELVVVAARPSMGKTSFALNVAHRLAVKDGKGVLIFSMEMDREQVLVNMLCAAASIAAHDLRRGSLSEEELGRLSTAAGEVGDAAIWIDDSPGLSVLQVRAKSRALRRRNAVDLIVVDYLQLMETHDRRRDDNRQQEITAISRGLKGLARELEVPVLVLSQLNRSVETRTDHEPRLSDLRESGAIEQDADVVLLLWRPSFYQPTDENRREAKFRIAKNRCGPTGVVDLDFYAEHMRFKNPVAEINEVQQELDL